MALSVIDFLETTHVKVTHLRNNMRDYMDIAEDSGVIVNQTTWLVNMQLIDRAYELKDAMEHIPGSLLIVSNRLMEQYKDDEAHQIDYILAQCLFELSSSFRDIIANTETNLRFKDVVTKYCLMVHAPIPEPDTMSSVSISMILASALLNYGVESDLSKMISIFAELLVVKASCNNVTSLLSELATLITKAQNKCDG